MKAVSSITTAVALAALSLATQASASLPDELHTFSGRCQMSGTVEHSTPLHLVVPRTTDSHAKLTGTCAGSLDGGAWRVHAVEGEATTHGSGTCPAWTPSVAGPGVLRFVETGDEIDVVAESLAAAQLHFTGRAGGHALGQLSAGSPASLLEITKDCVGVGAAGYAIKLIAKTVLGPLRG